MNDFKRDYRFHQNVMTPKGPATFIGYMDQGFECQVSRWKGSIVVNEIYPLNEITEAKEPIRAKSRKATVSQVLDAATV